MYICDSHLHFSTQTYQQTQYSCLFIFFSVPVYIHSDHGDSFMSEQLRQFLQEKGVTTRWKTPCHSPVKWWLWKIHQHNMENHTAGCHDPHIPYHPLRESPPASLCTLLELCYVQQWILHLTKAFSPFHKGFMALGTWNSFSKTLHLMQ